MVTICCCGVAGCGLFSPREDFELPRGDQGVGDPFNFGFLMEGSPEYFRTEQLKPLWSELFDDELVYTNNLSSEKFNRDEVVSNLVQIYNRQRNYRVIWKKDKDFPSYTKNEIVLETVEYNVVDPDSSDTVPFSGSCNFTIVRDEKDLWRIKTWMDITSKGSFFAPVGEADKQ